MSPLHCLCVSVWKPHVKTGLQWVQIDPNLLIQKRNAKPYSKKKNSR